jgi:hypothetical protein
MPHGAVAVLIASRKSRSTTWSIRPRFTAHSCRLRAGAAGKARQMHEVIPKQPGAARTSRCAGGPQDGRAAGTAGVPRAALRLLRQVVEHDPGTPDDIRARLVPDQQGLGPGVDVTVGGHSSGRPMCATHGNAPQGDLRQVRGGAAASRRDNPANLAAPLGGAAAHEDPAREDLKVPAWEQPTASAGASASAT